MPFWLCYEYRACVFCEAVSRITGIPAILYLDSFRCSIVSPVHKEVCVDAGGFASMMRPWFSGVGDPGAGKSHAADPCVSLVEEVCSERSSYAVGNKEDGFHVVRSRTYAAFEDKMRDTSGYSLLLTGEGSQYLCPTYLPRVSSTMRKGLSLTR